MVTVPYRELVRPPRSKDEMVENFRYEELKRMCDPWQEFIIVDLRKVNFKQKQLLCNLFEKIVKNFKTEEGKLLPFYRTVTCFTPMMFILKNGPKELLKFATERNCKFTNEKAGYMISKKIQPLHHAILSKNLHLVKFVFKAAVKGKLF